MTRPHSLLVAIGTAALVAGFAFAAPAALAATATAPSAPTGLAAIPGNTTVTLDWVAPSANGSPILGYNLYQGTSAGGESASPLNGSTLISATTATVTGLTNAKTYYFVAKAVNAIGTSPASNEVWAVPAATVPGAPRLVVAVAGDVSATVSWSAPTSPGGSNITRYTVLAHNLTAPSSGAQTCIWTTGPLSCQLTGLTNGDSYNFTVTATNSLGTGGTSNPSATVIPTVTAPLAPTGAVATPGNTTVQLSWVAPSNGGSAITGYNVFDSKTAGGENYSTPVNGTTLLTTTGTTVTGLVNDTEYYFTVKAVNAIGSSVPSGEVWAIPAGIVPSAPKTVTAVRGYESATVRWPAPLSSGGSAIGRYNVTATDSTVSSRGGQSCVWTTGPLSCVVTGLTDGDSYTFTVVATNSVGSSVASPASNAVVPAVSAPEAPVSLSVVPGNTTVELSWSAPVDNGSTIVGYNLYEGLSSGGESATPVNGSVLITTTQVTVSNLTNGHAYYYNAKAVNTAGTSAASNEVWAIPSPTVPGVPTNVTASPLGNESAVVTWTPPASMGGSAVSAYTVTPYLGASAQPTTSFGPTANSGTVTGLIPGSAYTFTVEALNASGSSAASEASPATLLPRASTTGRASAVGAQGHLRARTERAFLGQRGSKVLSRRAWRNSGNTKVHDHAVHDQGLRGNRVVRPSERGAARRFVRCLCQLQPQQQLRGLDIYEKDARSRQGDNQDCPEPVCDNGHIRSRAARAFLGHGEAAVLDDDADRHCHNQRDTLSDKPLVGQRLLHLISHDLACGHPPPRCDLLG